MRRLLHCVIPVVVLLVWSGCGGRDDERRSPAAADATSTGLEKTWPRADRRPLAEILGPLPEGPELTPSVSVLEKGTNRFGFVLYDMAGKQVTGAPVAVYVSDADGSTTRGPFTAQLESLRVDVAFRARGARDPDAPRSLYVAQLPLDHAGAVAVVAVVKLDGRLVATRAHVMRVGGRGGHPVRVGQRAPVIHTETHHEVLARTDTAFVAAPRLRDVDAADVLGRKPTVLVFSTPRLCTSRICTPVADVAAQIQAEAGTGVAVIQQDVHLDGDARQARRAQARAYGLRTEPWTFVVARDGRVAARFEGAVGVAELRRAVERALRTRG